MSLTQVGDDLKARGTIPMNCKTAKAGQNFVPVNNFLAEKQYLKKPGASASEVSPSNLPGIREIRIPEPSE